MVNGRYENLAVITTCLCPACDIVLMREAVSMEREIYKQTEEAELEDVDETEEGFVAITLSCKKCKETYRFK